MNFRSSPAFRHCVTGNPALWKVLLAFAAIYLVWGSTYLAIMIGLRSFTPFLMAGIRFLLAGLLIYLWCFLRRNVVLPSRKHMLRVAIAGVLMLSVGSGSVMWVEQYLTSAATSIIWATLPFCFIVLDVKQWAVHFLRRRVLIGLIIGFLGVVCLLSNAGDIFVQSGLQLTSIGVAFIGVLVFSIASLYQKHLTPYGPDTVTIAIQLVAAGICSVLVGIFAGELRDVDLASVSVDSILALLYLVIFGSIIAYSAYVWLLTIKSSSVVGTYTYVNPVVAVALGYFILKESVSTFQLLALLMILSGVLLTNFSKTQKIKEYDCKNVAR